VSGAAVWPGEVHKLSVNDGLVNTILGTKTSLDDVDFSRTLYLEITVEADGDDQITAADPPLLPRQILLPSLFSVEAGDARKLNGFQWSDLMAGNSPNPITGKISGAKLVPGSVGVDQVASGTITEDKIGESAVTNAKIADGTISIEKLAISQSDVIIPPGSIMPYGGPTRPPGWLLCDGQQVSREDYHRLFSAIGTAWGVGDSITTFNLPDLRGYFLRGRDHGTGRDPDSRERTGSHNGNSGDAVGSYQQDELRSHKHSVPLDLHGAADNFSLAWSPDANEDYALNLGTGYTGGSETRPKNAYVDFIIKY
jgi:microcystin-dependent protein